METTTTSLLSPLLTLLLMTVTSYDYWIHRYVRLGWPFYLKMLTWLSDSVCLVAVFLITSTSININVALALLLIWFRLTLTRLPI